MKILGRKEKVDLPDFGLMNISVKIDSGAYSCSIHCEFIKEVKEEKSTILKVVFLDDSLPKYTGEIIEFKQYEKKKVKSSTGEVQERFFVKVKVKLFEEEILTDFSLTQRNGLKNPILIGRKVLNRRFLIDTSKVNLSSSNKKNK
ncbi:MAG: ATP-dependent zinc protease [Flavobacteriia bacterium]|nr:ATP-dependent zinc protease [Flavobacteriia bacterium]